MQPILLSFYRIHHESDMCKQMVFQLIVAVVEAKDFFAFASQMHRSKKSIKCSRALQCCIKPETFTVCVSFFLILIKRNCMEHISYVAVDGWRSWRFCWTTFHFLSRQQQQHEEDEALFLSLVFMICFSYFATKLHRCDDTARTVKKSSQFSSCVSHSMCITNVIAAL